MNLPRFGLTHPTIVLVFVVVILATGLFNLSTMSRREDPEITIRDALVLTNWPGASAQRVADLITDPLEAAISEISEVDTIKSKSLVGTSIIQVTLDDAIQDTDQIWDDLRAKIRLAQGKLPLGAGRPFVNSDFGDVFEIVFAVYQTPLPGKQKIEKVYGFRQLEKFAERIEDQLELIDSVAKVEFWGVQPERIYVEVDSADLAKLEITPSGLRNIFEARNIVAPGGELDTDRGRYAISPTGDFSTVDQITKLVVGRRDGVLPVRLGDLPIRVSRRYEEPSKSLTRYTAPGLSHQPALVLGVAMKSERNVVAMGKSVKKTLARLKNGILPPDLKLTRVNDLPRQVDSRIKSFQVNLMQGVAIVLLVAFLTMGWRPAMIMATAVPLSMIASLAVVRPLGIELEQFAIASLIITLGMVVDNAIVVSDNTVRLIREGQPKFDACIEGAQSLAVPILTSTLTTIFAFLPMLTIVGNVGEYVSSLPIVVAATLSASYLVAMLLTPLTCWWLLKVPTTDRQPGQTNIAGRSYERFIGWAIDHKTVVIGCALVAFLASLSIIPIIGNQFFPSGARDQFFVKIWMPEGAPIAATSKLARTVEKDLIELSAIEIDGQKVERLSNAVTFIGTGGPRLMLTQEPEYNTPYFSFILVNTTDARFTDSYVKAVRERVSGIPEARITVDKFVLGPPIKDPVAFRVSGPDSKVLRNVADQIVRIFKSTPGTSSVYSNWGTTGYQVDVEINSDAANLAGVTNADVAVTLRSLLSGAPLTTFREGDHLVPVVFRTLREKREDLGDLSGIYVNGSDGKVPLEAVAKVTPGWKPAVIARRDRIPTVTIGARVDEGLLANDVAAQIKPKIETLLATLPPGYQLEQGGEHEETIKALTQVVRAVFIAIVLITLVLTVQYNQLLKPQIILFTVPMALIGVLVGLLITGWAMGFMAMLGALALSGIVINNAIILIDFIEARIADGVALRDAVVQAGRMRMRPILLTTVTTIGGLLPLSLFGGPLWAPMTNGMIFGLVFATLLTLVVVPVLYVTFAEKLRMRVV